MPVSQAHNSAVKPDAVRITTSAFALAVLGVLIFSTWSARASADGNDSGAALFKTKCVACHGPDGSGDTPVGKSLKSADLRSPEVQKKSNAELAEFITTGKGNMPSFRSSTTDDEIRAIVAHVRTFAAKKAKKPAPAK